MRNTPCRLAPSCSGQLTYDLATRRDGQRVACDACGTDHVWSASLEAWVAITAEFLDP